MERDSIEGRLTCPDVDGTEIDRSPSTSRSFGPVLEEGKKWQLQTFIIFMLRKSICGKIDSSSGSHWQESGARLNITQSPLLLFGLSHLQLGIEHLTMIRLGCTFLNRSLYICIYFYITHSILNSFIFTVNIMYICIYLFTFSSYIHLFTFNF